MSRREIFWEGEKERKKDGERDGWERRCEEGEREDKK